MRKSKSLIYSLLTSLVIALIVEHRVFYDLTAINDDVRNQIYWMARFIDPKYFSNDYIAAYFTQPSMISPVLGWLYQSLSQFADPKLATQFLVFPIIVLTTFFLFKAAEVHAGSRYAFWVTYVFNLYIWTMKYTAGALPRSYFYLLFFMFLWTLGAKRWNLLILCLALQTLIYPITFFLSFLTLIIELVWMKKQHGKLEPKLLSTTLIGFAAGALVLYLRYMTKPLVNEFGSMTSLKDALQMPEFYLDGRACVFIVPFRFSLSQSLSGLPYLLVGLLLIAISVYVFNRFVKPIISTITLPGHIQSSGIASIILFVVAYQVLFYLYLPHRYITYVLPLVPIFMLGSLFYQLDLAFAKRRVIICLLTLFTLVIMVPHWNDDLIEIPKSERRLYAFLQTVPREALIVAPLKLASNIPAFSYRSVLVSSETNIPFHVDYYKEIQARTAALDLIYNSHNPMEIINIINQYHVNYIVLDLKQNNDRTLQSISGSETVYATKRFVVVKVKP